MQDADNFAAKTAAIVTESITTKANLEFSAEITGKVYGGQDRPEASSNVVEKTESKNRKCCPRKSPVKQK